MAHRLCAGPLHLSRRKWSMFVFTASEATILFRHGCALNTAQEPVLLGGVDVFQKVNVFGVPDTSRLDHDEFRHALNGHGG